MSLLVTTLLFAVLAYLSGGQGEKVGTGRNIPQLRLVNGILVGVRGI